MRVAGDAPDHQVSRLPAQLWLMGAFVTVCMCFPAHRLGAKYSGSLQITCGSVRLTHLLKSVWARAQGILYFHGNEGRARFAAA